MNVMTNVVISVSDLAPVRIGPSEPQNRVMRGDLLFNGSSEVPEEVCMCSVLLDDVGDVYLNSFCFALRPYGANLTDGRFMAYYFRSGAGRDAVKSLAQGSTRYNMSKAALKELSLYLPAFDEQVAIATVLSDMDSGLLALEAKLSKARDVKQGMMQQLLTGKIRLL